MSRLLRRSFPPLEAFHHPRAAAEVGGRLAPRGDAVQREGQLGGDAAGGLGVDGEGIPVNVVNSVAGKVVAGVFGITGAGKEAGGRNTELEEADIIRAATERPKEGEKISTFPRVGSLLGSIRTQIRSFSPERQHISAAPLPGHHCY